MDYKHIKRAFDLTVSAAALVALSPVITVSAAWSAAVHKKNPFISVPRLGKDGKVFKIYKIRSMKGEVGTATDASEKDFLTGFGRFIRRMSIDELPQFVNVLKGDMSLVGPRPFGLKTISAQDFIENDEIRQRYSVKPGMASSVYLLQDALNKDLAARISEDARYASNLSFKEDAGILFGLAKVMILHGKEEAQKNSVTKEFSGNIPSVTDKTAKKTELHYSLDL